MSETAPAFRPRLPVASLASGIASGALYVSIFLSFAFLVPVQIAYGRAGRREGLLGSGAALIVIVLIQSIRLIAAGVFGLESIALGALPPLVLYGALALMNAPFWKGRLADFRSLAAATACALIALPGIIALSSDAGFTDMLSTSIAAVLGPLGERVAEAGEGYDQATLSAVLDPLLLAQTAIRTIRDSYAAILLSLLGGSWWIGNRASGMGSPGRERSPAIDEIRLPYFFVWPFLASWATLLAAIFFKAPEAAAAVTWNCALCLSLGYAAQGLGIADHLLKRWKTPKGLRVLLAATIVVAAASSVAGIAILVAIPLLGVTETWIPYRNPKGVGA